MKTNVQHAEKHFFLKATGVIAALTGMYLFFQCLLPQPFILPSMFIGIGLLIIYSATKNESL